MIFEAKNMAAISKIGSRQPLTKNTMLYVRQSPSPPLLFTFSTLWEMYFVSLVEVRIFYSAPDMRMLRMSERLGKRSLLESLHFLYHEDRHT